MQNIGRGCARRLVVMVVGWVWDLCKSTVSAQAAAARISFPVACHGLKQQRPIGWPQRRRGAFLHLAARSTEYLGCQPPNTSFGRLPGKPIALRIHKVVLSSDAWGNPEVWFLGGKLTVEDSNSSRRTRGLLGSWGAAVALGRERGCRGPGLIGAG